MGNAKYRGVSRWAIQELFAGKGGKTRLIQAHRKGGRGWNGSTLGKSGLLLVLRRSKSHVRLFSLSKQLACGRFELVAPRTQEPFVYLHPVSAVIRNVLPRRSRRPCGPGASAGNKGAVVHISCDPDTRELVSVICGATEQCPFLSRAGLSMVADVSRLVFPGIQLHVLRGKCRD